MLDRYIAEAHQKPFSYDWHEGIDCCVFTWNAIHAQTGKYVGARFRRTYTTRREARKVMKEYCGLPCFVTAITKLMREEGFETVHPLQAQRGDAVLCPLGFGYFLGVLDLNGKDVLGIGEHGVKRVQLSIRCRAWRIQ